MNKVSKVSKILRITGIVLFTILVLIATALFILAKTVDPNRYRNHVAHYLSQVSGQPVDIVGPLHFSYFPWLGLQVSKISLKPCAYIENLALKVRVLPLFLGRIEIGTIRLEAARWCIVIGKRKEKTQSPTSTPAHSRKNIIFLPLHQLDIRHFEIVHSKLRLINQKTRQQYDLTDIQCSAKVHVDLLNQTFSAQSVLLRLNAQSPYSTSIPITVRGDLDFSAANQGQLTINPLHLTADSVQWDEKIRVTQLLNPSPDAPQFWIETNARQLDLGDLSYILYHRRPVLGTLNFDSQLTTRGRTAQAILSHASGKGMLTVEHGRLEGIDLSYLAATGMAFINQKPLTLFPHSPLETNFSIAKASYKIDRGIITNNDLELVTDNIRCTGHGMIHLLSKTIDYRLMLQTFLDQPNQGRKVNIPVDIRGFLSEPSIKINMQSLAEEQVGNEVKRFLDKNKKGLDKILKSFFK